jgi:DNA polymerase (family 10)
MENPEVAQVFDEVADLLELQSANPFRIRAYRNASRVIRDLSQPLSAIVERDGHTLAELPGIGEDLAGKIATIVTTGDLPLRRELCRKVPAGLRELLRLPGCGPKRVQLLHDRLHIRSLAGLRQALKRHTIRNLKGFGPKSEENLLKALGEIDRTEKRVYLADAKVFVEAISEHLQAAAGVEQVQVAGSYRRRKETVGDLDVLVCARRAGPVMDRLAEFPGVREVLARGGTKMSVRLTFGLNVDLRVIPAASYGAALVYFTGSKQHNIDIRKIALEKELKINEYGVFRGNKRIAGRTEAEVYRSIGLPWIPPELREARGELELASEGRLPELVELQDIRGDLHMHTVATDGRNTIEEMIAAARSLGRSYIAITDHSKRVTMAKGLTALRLRAHWRAIEKAAEHYSDIHVLKGVEVDILEDGRLDLPDSVLAEADWVVASIHYGQNQPQKQITKRLLNAIRHPHVHAIGHPTGRLIGVRKPQEIDLKTVLQAAADYGCLMELNCQPSRLDLNDVNLATAVEAGVEIVLGTDAHSVEELTFMEFGVYQARRAGLQAKSILNCQSVRNVLKRIRRR